MKIKYSNDVDALYLRLNDAPIVNTDAISEDIIIDYDSNKNVVGIEILSVSEKGNAGEIIVQAFDKVFVETS